MKINTFEVIWLVGLAIYLFLIYHPRRLMYRRKKTIGLQSSPVDIALDILTWVFWQVIPLVYIFSAWLDFANYTLPAWAGAIGVVLFAASLLLYWSAYRTLSINWSPKIEILEEQSLVTSGVYAHIRHPVYAAMFLWGLAQPLMLHNWLAGTGLILLFIVLYILRMPREEKMLIEHFGEEYREYMARTGRILPRLQK